MSCHVVFPLTCVPDCATLRHMAQKKSSARRPRHPARPSDFRPGQRVTYLGGDPDLDQAAGSPARVADVAATTVSFQFARRGYQCSHERAQELFEAA